MQLTLKIQSECESFIENGNKNEKDKKTGVMKERRRNRRRDREKQQSGAKVTRIKIERESV